MSFFEDFFNGMGHDHFPGHEHFQDENKEEIDTQEFYKRLGISKSASLSDIKRAYRKQALKLHPDKHPNEKDKYKNLFQQVQEAYEVLSDEHKRKLYDQGGIKLVKDHEKFKGRYPFFGGNRRESYRKKKSPPIQKQLQVTLEELYRGSNRKIKITRKTDEKGSRVCKLCKGTGKILISQQIGPMIIQQHRTCNECEGQGYILKEISANISFNIPVGGRNGEKVIIRGEGHKYPNHESGDIIIKLIEKKHNLYTRQGVDLSINYELSLIEALCGYEIKLPHVSGTILCINSNIDDETKQFIPVQPGDLKVVYSKGMPERFNTHVKGNLYICMKVKLPLFKQIDSKKLNQLKQILPYTETNLDIKKALSKCSTSRKDIDDKNNNNNNNNDSTKNKKNKNSRKNIFSDDIIEEVECENVKGKSHTGPNAAKGAHYEDKNNKNRRGEYECHQM